MSNALSTEERVGFVEEASWGTTPASALKLLRFVNVSGKPDKQSKESEENTRETADIVMMSKKGGLDIGGELSYGTLDDLLVGLLGSAGWSANVLKVGTTRTSYTVERQFPTAALYHAYTGAIPNKLSITVSVGNFIKWSMGFMSKFPDFGTSTVGTGSATAVNTNAIMDPVGSIQLAQEGGSGSIAGITEFTINITNNLIEFPQLGSPHLADLQIGSFMIDGSFSCYYASNAYLTKYAAHTLTSLALTLGGSAALKYAISLPKVYLTDASQDDGGKNQPIIAKYGFKCRTDSTDTTLKITRTP